MGKATMNEPATSDIIPLAAADAERRRRSERRRSSLRQSVRSIHRRSSEIFRSTRAIFQRTTKSPHDMYKQTPTPEETAGLVSAKLDEFEAVLMDIGPGEKQGYLMAKEKGPEQCDDAFKLVFLRCEVFNVKKAVRRWVRYWDARIKVFGEDKAFLSLTLDNARDCVAGLDYLQVATKTDPDGRAILLFDFNKDGSDVPSDILERAVWCQVHRALATESAQKRGVVVYSKMIDNFYQWRPSLSKKIAVSGKGILPVRFAGMHIVYPPTHMRVILRITRALVGPKLKNRIYVHSGSEEDVLESLSCFGLGTKEMLPALFGGSLDFCE